MTSPAFETFLARLYSDDATLARFLTDRVTVARAAGLTPSEVMALTRVDAGELRLAAVSFASKRAAAGRRGPGTPAGPKHSGGATAG